MMMMTEVVVLVLLALLCMWRFRRSSMYRNRRRYGGGVPGQFTRPEPTYHGLRLNAPLQRPEILRDDDSTPSRRWWRSHSRQPGAKDTA
jgi:hypothetical protein